MKAGLRNAQSGFGLIEIMISIVVLGLVGATTFYFLHSQNTNTGLGTDISKGMFVAKCKLDSLRVNRYGSLATGCDTVNNRFIRQWFVTTDLLADRKTIQLQVSWPLSAQHTITFNTIVGDDQYKVY
ncbi:MAG: prepilin-type N-terminal cleavage/methylation domain-containing protein [Fibrobacteres bacterium]|nr:prepilin-type N-terminal cleavage/methylation domain-containing protein [Fibrobacterota bacterium]